MGEIMPDYLTVHVNRKFLIIAALLLASYLGGKKIYSLGIERGVELSVQYLRENAAVNRSHRGPMSEDF